MKIYSTSFPIKETITVRYHFIYINMATIKNMSEETGTHAHY